MSLQMTSNTKLVGNGFIPKCKYFVYKFNGEINGIVCSNGKDDIRYSQVDSKKHNEIFVYSCCSEIGCKKCNAYKHLKSIEKR